MYRSGLIREQKVTEIKFLKSKQLRHNQTKAESLLWQRLRNNKIGCKFRRQQIIKGFIADFYCEKFKLVIEVDGLVHNDENQKLYDLKRKEFFESINLKELRFTNSEIENNIESVIRDIKRELVNDNSSPSPMGEGVGG